MSAISSKLPDEFKQRIVAEAKSEREKMLKTGKGYDADEVHAYLKARAAGKKPAKPKAKSWKS